jgi:hypothetical protein
MPETSNLIPQKASNHCDLDHFFFLKIIEKLSFSLENTDIKVYVKRCGLKRR